MLPMPAEEKALLKQSLAESARLMRKYTEPEKLKDFKFKDYLSKHWGRIPDYRRHQQLGITIGFGDVESKIKQVGTRVKLSGARWNRQNVTRILRLRCAYLNLSPLLSLNVLS
ncbi:hypothetical protein IQ218_15540 [Synechocystis salina LEGE 06099]|uniref:hypothetical protein n=1 Tax=Synechocystis salina TaxID=945780 RepID=UPI001881F12C|nr:hypothetical protein [Synechocystis salina]MBE9204590.1 hypothetical protein [Synechocystis salina LEGE 06099]